MRFVVFSCSDYIVYWNIIWIFLQYWPCTHYRKGPIAEISYLFQYRAFLLFFCVHIVKYLYKLMLCWKFHITPTRNSQDMDHWNTYLHFLGQVRLGDSANECTWTFPFSKAFQKIIFFFYFNSFTMLRKNSGNDKFYWMTLWNRHL